MKKGKNASTYTRPVLSIEYYSCYVTKALNSVVHKNYNFKTFAIIIDASRMLLFRSNVPLFEPQCGA